MHFKSVAFFLLITFPIVLDTQAQQSRPGGMGGPPQPRFGAAMAKLFGENSAFTAEMQMEVKSQSGPVSIPGKLAFLDGKSRFEMDVTKMEGGNIPPQAAAQMKQMGMGEMISISRPDKRESYLIYPGLKSYAAIPEPQNEVAAAATSENFDLKRTEIGKETVDGHECTKYKVVIKTDDGKEQESVLWAASDLNGFPIKMETVNEGFPTTLTFKEVKLSKPDEALFNPPSDFQRYTDMGTMMREAMMKRFAPPAGAQPSQE